MKKTISFLVILLADLLSLVLSFYISYLLRIKIIPSLITVTNPWFFPLEHFYGMYYLLSVFIMIFFYEKLYTRRYTFFEELVYITRGLIISIAFIALFVYLSRSFESFSRTIPVLMVPTGMVIIPLMRFLVKKVLMACGLYIKNALVVGRIGETSGVIPSLKKLENTGIRIKRILEVEEEGFSDNFKQNLRKGEEETLFIVSRGLVKDELNQLINICEEYIKEIKIISDSDYLRTIGVETEYIDELLIMRMSNKLLSPANRFFKRMFDILFSLLAVVLLLPVFLLIAIAIKLGSKGSILYIQERFGKAGLKFKFLKFRSMYPDASDRLQKYLAHNPLAKEEWIKYKKLKRFDPRVTPFGKFLRRFSLDEAPQFFNVLRGEMSIVGPRPYLVREKDEIEKSAAIIFRVKSGLTGLWQIKGRSELVFEDRLKLDEFYVRNWSLFQDIIIILKTFSAVITGKGAY